MPSNLINQIKMFYVTLGHNHVFKKPPPPPKKKKKRKKKKANTRPWRNLNDSCVKS